jgi:hypothetical protein
VSVQHWSEPLEEGPVKEVLLSREAYRRTEFIVLRGDEGATALVRIDCSAREALFNPITAVEWLAGPDDCVYVVRPDVDTANASALAEVALSAGRPAVCVVEGLYQHVNFIVRAAPLEVRLVDVVPPGPARLLDLARQAIAIDEDLPPVRPRRAITCCRAKAPGWICREPSTTSTSARPGATGSWWAASGPVSSTAGSTATNRTGRWSCAPTA